MDDLDDSETSYRIDKDEIDITVPIKTKTDKLSLPLTDTADDTTTGRSCQTNLLNQAMMNSKPMSVLDELETFWEKTDASKGVGQRGILAEHIMEK